MESDPLEVKSVIDDSRATPSDPFSVYVREAIHCISLPYYKAIDLTYNGLDKHSLKGN